MTNLIRWPICGFNFLSELFDIAWLDLSSFNAWRTRWDLFYAKISGNHPNLASLLTSTLTSTDHHQPFSHASRILDWSRRWFKISSDSHWNEQPFKIIHTFSFAFCINFSWVIAKAGSLNSTLGVDVITISSVLRFDRSGDSYRELQLLLNKSWELIERFLSKLISQIHLFTDVMPFRCFYSNSNAE